jgi:hypothetical protein
MKFLIQILLLLMGTMLTISCTGFQKKQTKEAETQALIDKKVAEKVDLYRSIRLQKCRERILERASELADSIIRATAVNSNIIDNTTRPVPPPRPARPEIKMPIDTTPVKPFFPIDTTQ